jgi:hypothetical protein
MFLESLHRRCPNIPVTDVGLEPLPDATKARKAVSPDWILVSWLNGMKVSWPEPFGTEGKPETQAFAEDFFPRIHKLFSDNWFKLHPISEVTGGFEALLEGIDLVRNGKVRGTKLVYRTADRKAAETGDSAPAITAGHVATTTPAIAAAA